MANPYTFQTRVLPPNPKGAKLNFTEMDNNLLYLSQSTVDALDMIQNEILTAYATTGSNAFIGNQQIAGNVVVTGSLTVSGSSTMTLSATNINLTGSTANTGDFFVNDGAIVLASNNVDLYTASIDGSDKLNISAAGSTTYLTLASTGDEITLRSAGAVNISGSTFISGSTTTQGSITTTGSITAGIENGNESVRLMTNTLSEVMFRSQGSNRWGVWASSGLFSIQDKSTNNLVFQASQGDYTIVNARNNLYLQTNGSNRVNLTTSSISFIGLNTTISGSSHSITGTTTITGSLIASGSSHTLSGSVGISGSLTLNGQAITAGSSINTGSLQSTKITGSLIVTSSGTGGGLIVVGPLSVGDGGSTLFTGTYSAMIGEANTASGQSSFAQGYNNSATNTNAFAQGDTNEASGAYSFARGLGNKAIGQSSFASGEGTSVTGNEAHGFGYQVSASGAVSTAMGQFTTASGAVSTATGRGTAATADFQFTVGKWNATSTTIGSFIVGNGADANNRSTLLEAGGTSVRMSGSLAVTGSIIASGSLQLLGGEIRKISQRTATFTGSLNESNTYILNNTFGSTRTTFFPAAPASGQTFTVIAWSGSGQIDFDANGVTMMNPTGSWDSDYAGTYTNVLNGYYQYMYGLRPGGGGSAWLLINRRT